ncbi:MAG: iron-sulfur cluster assembly accessory protein [Chlamydiae bacterium]|nr:iron-sulfur cluster assembly accessory protein [Chlamydiota bacterium]MBI3266957.1 iron-sulfur cluster assembly accessory protein [Chlamydiota bacterium]
MIQLTPGAVEEVKKMMEREKRSQAGLRLAVKGGGCSGYSYSIDLDDQSKEGDKVFESEGIKVFVDGKSYFLLNGSVLDYTKGTMGSSFTFQNPNAKGSCGCGASFNV